MDKRYQVFVSSTYRDLVEERREVIQALLELDCIPSGMELFLAANDDQWSLIQGIIDDCDYYLVIVGGRYGSLSKDGVGYTEREYDYAVSVGKPILGFVHENPGDIRAADSEADPRSVEKLKAFREKVMERPIRTYRSPEQLGSVVSRSLVGLMKSTPAEGWIRGRHAMTDESRQELSRLQAEVAELKLVQATQSLNSSEELDLYAQGSDTYALGYERYSFSYGSVEVRERGEFLFTWDEIFAALGPLMMDEASESALRNRLGSLLSQSYSKVSEPSKNIRVSQESFDAVKVQLRALMLIEKGTRKRAISDKATYWRLTERGDLHLVKLIAMKREQVSDK